VSHSTEDSSQRFRSLADNSPDLIVRYDRQLRRTYVNLTWEKATGIPAAIATNQSPVEQPGLMRAGSSEYAAYEQKLRTVLDTGKPLDTEVSLMRPDGTVVHLERRIVPEFDSHQQVISVLSISRDITERKNNEDMLRIAAAAFETHEAILITDASGRIIRVNQTFQDITGYAPQDVLGEDPRMLDADSKDAAAQRWQSIQHKGSWTGEAWGRRKNGETFPAWMTVTAVKDQQGTTKQYVGIFSDVSESRKAQDEIIKLASYDPLTKLPNRRLLLERFQAALALSSRSQRHGAVLFLDMDRFKRINDYFGHNYGDLLLIEVARRLRACVRGGDTVARLGGDEFVVLLEDVDGDAERASQKVARVADKLRRTLALPYSLNEITHHSTPSIGVCLFRGDEQSVDALLKYADVAMYQAKDAGRNAVRFYDPIMQKTVEERIALEADMRLAIRNRQFSLYYQVQVDNSSRAMGAEALIRWQHPQRGMVSPAAFIPVAEESSLIVEIGHWVLETACQQLARWGKEAHSRSLELAVNVSAQQFRQADFVERVTALLRKHAINPARLKLELTEGAMLDDVAGVASKMHGLKALGIKLSLDDFGTGYSSLAYLKQLPLDQLKIDQSFVRNITVESKDAILVRTIIDMAKNFGLNVIAEGVETVAQLDFLRQNGCMAYQGYLFGRPIPADAFAERLAASALTDTALSLSCI
jgi:diguanylate cyclase (GGDEF)-like protein/PAS domain S-box-containing protein